MRRSEKEIKDIKLIYSILNEAEICRVGFSRANKPYIVLMNFGFDEGHIYLHSSVEGKKNGDFKGKQKSMLRSGC